MLIPLPSSVRYTAGGMARLEVSTPSCTAEIHLQGAQITAWTPSHAGAPVVWSSAHSLFEPGRPIRGGAPICFPWFGPHQDAGDAPMHGFVRTVAWRLIEGAEAPDGTVRLAFALDHEGASSPLWPHAYRIVHRVALGARLTSVLEVTNLDAAPFTFEEALHTYFAVDDIEAVTITGLEGTEYIDKAAGFARRRQGDAPVRFDGETDRVYLDTAAECAVHDDRLRRRIVIRKSGSRSTVVWNPWIARARALPDFGDDEWRGMVCVETANAARNAVQIDPGGTHVMRTDISVERA